MEFNFNLTCWIRHDYELVRTCDKRFSTTYSPTFREQYKKIWTVVFYRCKVCGKRHSEHNHPDEDGKHEYIDLARAIWKNTGILPDLPKTFSHAPDPFKRDGKIESMLQAALTTISDDEANNFLMMARKLYNK